MKNGGNGNGQAVAEVVDTAGSSVGLLEEGTVSGGIAVIDLENAVPSEPVPIPLSPRRRKMMMYRVRCVGVTPLLMDRMSTQTLESLATKVKIQAQNDRSHEDVAKDKIYVNEDGVIGLNTDMFFACLINGGRRVPFGSTKSKLSTAESSVLPGLIMIPEEFLPLSGTDKWVVDMRRGVLEANNAAVAIRRPKFNTWSFDATIVFDANEISWSTLEELISKAGQFEGLGSFRPNCKGRFGRFELREIFDITPAEWKANHAAPIQKEPTKKTGRKKKGDSDTNGASDDPTVGGRIGNLLNGSTGAGNTGA